jgi:hypothetical protein
MVSQQEYVRENVNAYPLGPLLKFSEYPSDDDSLINNSRLPLPVRLPPAVKVELCRYKNHNYLDPELWSFEDFVKTHAREWYEWDDCDYHSELSEDEKTRRVRPSRAAATAPKGISTGSRSRGVRNTSSGDSIKGALSRTSKTIANAGVSTSILRVIFISSFTLCGSDWA